MNRMIRLAFLIIIVIACKKQAADEGGTQAEPPVIESDTVFLEVTVNNLRMRSEPTLTSSTILMLPESVKVRYWQEHSSEKTEVNLRGESISEYWYRVKYGKETGWVFGGALKNVEQKEAFDHIIIPGERVGPVRSDDTEQSIIDRLGGAVVERGEFAIGEGESVTATYLFPSSENELILLWDQADFKNLREVRIRKSGSKWKLTSGIGIGSSLKEVAAANNGPFMLSGFEWDFAGTTLNWQGGNLSEKLTLIFDPPSKIHKTLIGDHSISSDNERMSKANPKVKVIRVLF